MAVLIDVVGNVVVGGVASSSPQTYTGLTTGASLPNGCVTFIVLYDNLAVTGTSATWDGVPCFLIASQNATGGTFGRVEIWGLSPIGTHTGNKTFSITFTGGTAQLLIHGHSWTGADQTGGSTTFNHSVGATANTNKAIGNVTSQIGDAVIAGFVNSGQITIQTSGINLFINNTPNNFNASGCRDVGVSSIAMSADYAGINIWAMAGANIAQSPQLRAPYLSKPVAPILAVPQSAPYNLSIYGAAPTPFAQLDWSKPFAVPLSSPWIQPLNINLFTNLIPFGPYDWNKSVNVPKALFDLSVSTNLQLFTNPLPFAQYDWSKPSTVPNAFASPTQSGLNLALLGVPMIPVDWSKPFDIPSLLPGSQPLNINLFTNPIPFALYDWNKPTSVSSVPSAPLPMNLSLLTAQAPFSQLDWSKSAAPRISQPLDLPNNINLFTNPYPFALYDWAKANPPKLVTPDQSNTNVALLTPISGTLPFNQYDWPKASSVPNAPFEYYNMVLVSVTTPFAQYDWSKPQQAPNWPIGISSIFNLSLSTAPVSPPFIPVDFNKTYSVPLVPPGSGPLNLNLFTNPFPFLPLDYSKSTTLPSVASFVQPYNASLYGVSQAPFFPVDWSKPFDLPSLVSAPLPLNINLFTNPIPFGPFDWSKTSFQTPRAPDQSYPNLPLLFGQPFVPIDWSKPYFPPPSPPPVTQALNLQLFTNPIPFVQLDWSKPQAVSRVLPPDQQPYNQKLFTNPIPFALYDWSKPTTVSSVPQAPLPMNLSLTFVQPPFAQYSWPLPVVVASAPRDRSTSLNPNLFSNQIPFAQYDWSKPVRVPQQPPRPESLNINMFTNLIPFSQYYWPRQFAVPSAPRDMSTWFNQNLPPIPPKPGKKRDTHDWIPKRRHPPVYDQEYYDRLIKKHDREIEEEDSIEPIEPVPNWLIPLNRLIAPMSIPTLNLSPPPRPMPTLTMNPPAFRMATPQEIAADDEMIIKMLLEED